MKNIITLILLLLTLNVKLLAADQITFTWKFEASLLNKKVKIQASEGETFTVNWGDNSEVMTETGAGNVDIELNHAYTIPDEYTVTITASGADCRFTAFSCKESNYLISSLTFSDCSALTDLDCSFNKLTSLDLASCTSLLTLNCHNNQLISLDLTNLSALSYLNCVANKLTNLSVRSCVALQTLECGHNQLTSLNLNGNSVLSELNCYDNQLTNLDLTGCTALSSLSCAHNRLTDLDLKDCLASTYVNLDNNQFPLSYLYKVGLFFNNNCLGTQNLPLKTISEDDVIDYSSEVELGGIATNFVIEKNGKSAILNVDYSMNNGIITFHHSDDFTVKMTNEAIVSHANCPAMVIASTTEFDDSDEIDDYFRESIKNIELIEITDDSLIFRVHSRINGGNFGPNRTRTGDIEYIEEGNNLKVNISYPQYSLAECVCYVETTIKIKKDVYTKAVVEVVTLRVIQGSTPTNPQYGDPWSIDIKEIDLLSQTGQIQSFNKNSSWTTITTNTFDNKLIEIDSYKVDGDTLIENKKYFKIFRNNDYYSALRKTDENRIYARFPESDKELLIYDFDWHPEKRLDYQTAYYDDILTLPWESIDSIQLLDGRYYKYVETEDAMIIKGIGDTRGFFASTFELPAGSKPELLCFYIDDVLVYSNANYNYCNTTTANTITYNDTEIKLYPNASNNTITVEFPKNHTVDIVEIVDAKGSLIKTYKVIGKDKIEIHNLEKGVYVYVVILENNQKISRKIIVK